MHDNLEYTSASALFAQPEELAESPSKCVKLMNILLLTAVNSEERFKEVEQDIREEAAKSGTVTKLVAPRPNHLLPESQ